MDEVAYPIDAFPSEFAEIIEQASITLKSEASHIGTAILGAVSLAIGNTTRVQVSPHLDSIPCTTWMALVEPSGAGKGKAQKFGFGPLNNIKKRKMVEVSNARTALKKEIDQLKRDLYNTEDANEKKIIRNSLEAKERQEIEDYYLTIDDITMEAVRKANLKNRRGIGIVRDEISGWYNSFGKYSKGGNASAEESFYIETYDGADLLPFRSGSSAVICPMPFTTVFGGTQPDTLTDLGRNNRMVSGFVYRILFSFPEEKALQKKSIDDFISSDATGGFKNLNERYHIFINKVMDELSMQYADEAEFIPEPKSVMFSKDALKVYIKWFNEQADFVNTLKVDKSIRRTIRSIVSRQEMSMFRLCLIMEVMKWTTGNSSLEMISADTVNRVAKIMEYYRYTMVKVYTEIEKIRFESGNARPKRVHIEYRKVFGKREELKREELLERINKNYGITVLTAEKYVLEDEKQLAPPILTRKDGRNKIYTINQVKK